MVNREGGVWDRRGSDERCEHWRASRQWQPECNELELNATVWVKQDISGTPGPRGLKPVAQRFTPCGPLPR